MTDEQRQRIHDIEYSCDSRAELAESIVGLEDEIKRLETCVLVLDSELADWKGQYDPTDIYIRKAQEENAKLRKLVADTYQAFQRVIPDGHRLDLEQRMRELGVEVDG